MYLCYRLTRGTIATHTHTHTCTYTYTYTYTRTMATWRRDFCTHTHIRTRTHARTHTLTDIHTHTHTHIPHSDFAKRLLHTYTHTFTHTRKDFCRHTHIHTHTHSLSHTHTHAHSHAHARAHTHTHAHTHTRTRTHTYTHHSNIAKRLLHCRHPVDLLHSYEKLPGNPSCSNVLRTTNSNLLSMQKYLSHNLSLTISLPHVLLALVTVKDDAQGGGHVCSSDTECFEVLDLIMTDFGCLATSITRFVDEIHHVRDFQTLVTGWRRCIGCLKLQVIFGKRATNY